MTNYYAVVSVWCGVLDKVKVVDSLEKAEKLRTEIKTANDPDFEEEENSDLDITIQEVTIE